MTPREPEAPRRPARPGRRASSDAHRKAMRAALSYVVLSLAWIIGSDVLVVVFSRRTVLDLNSTEHLLQTLKGAAFVLFTGLLLYLYLRAQWRQLIEAKEQAEASERLKDAFLANMSHEIRTPLTGVIGFAEILMEESGGNTREIAGLIREAGRRLMGTLNAVLDLAQLSANARPLRPETFDVCRDLSPLVAFWRRHAGQQGLAFDFECPSPCVVEVDRHALHRIVENLVSNALKFTARGRVALTIRHQAGNLVVQVEDTGAGIDPAFLPHLFEAFQQESVGLGRRHEGNGLGLAIMRRLVTLLTGRVEVDSRKGEGTRFTVYLPCPLMEQPGASVNAA